ncbi:MAG: YbaK/EbsC family protein [Clostridiaceae bacterium]|nr:YbaK/EbsC family protein [Clostridiaceae bacterium]
MSTESVRRFFLDQGMEDPVFELEESGATVEEAAKTLGVDAALIAKTLSFKVKDKSILIVMKGDARIDNKKFKSYFNVKAKMLEHDEVESITGHPVGGLCPFGLKSELEVYLDTSISNFEYIYPAAGSRYTALKISPQELMRLTSGTWIDVCQ